MVHFLCCDTASVASSRVVYESGLIRVSGVS